MIVVCRLEMFTFLWFLFLPLLFGLHYLKLYFVFPAILAVKFLVKLKLKTNRNYSVYEKGLFSSTPHSLR